MKKRVLIIGVFAVLLILSMPLVSNMQARTTSTKINEKSAPDHRPYGIIVCLVSQFLGFVQAESTQYSLAITGEGKTQLSQNQMIRKIAEKLFNNGFPVGEIILAEIGTFSNPYDYTITVTCYPRFWVTKSKTTSLDPLHFIRYITIKLPRA
ncbi:MAG: hypothetical protein JSW62_04675 [Thermoplasmatales archaeon]|nr:MAG: hypothetical protein JSW62_04675 [Thermoplasmatales archaeon]